MTNIRGGSNNEGSFGRITLWQRATRLLWWKENHYFPIRIDQSRSLSSQAILTPLCPWKGEASYYHIVVDGDKNEDAAWFLS